MKNISKIMLALIVAFGFSGCGYKSTPDGFIASSDSVMKENSNVKLFYKDLTEDLAIDANKRLVNDLNNEEIIPPVWYKVFNPENNELKKSKYKVEKNTTNKKVTGGKFALSEDGMYIKYDKVYNSTTDLFEDIQNIYAYIKEKLKSAELRDRYLTSVLIFDSKISMEKNQFVAETKYTYINKSLKHKIKRQIELGGWNMVDSPEKADKMIYVEVSRDYFTKELEELERAKKGIRFVSLGSGNKFDIQGNNNGNHIVVGQSAMNLASSSNSSIASAGIGLGVSMLFSLFGPSKQDVSGSLVSIRIIDKIKKTDYVKLYNNFIPGHYDTDRIYELRKNINETINLEPDSKEFNIN